MNESAVIPIATIAPAIPARVNVNPIHSPSNKNERSVIIVAISNDPTETIPSPR